MQQDCQGAHYNPNLNPWPRQGSTVRLETANAALLEGAADSWEAALTEGAAWRLVALVTPEP